MRNSIGNMSNSGDDGRWLPIKDRLAVMAVLVALLLLLFKKLEQAVINFRCSFGDFITFDCNRWGQIWEASRD